MATTPVDQRVVDEMIVCLLQDGPYGNTVSMHQLGREAKEKVEKARAQVARLIGADPVEIIWTSGATESINLALKGAAQFYARQGKHIITMRTEHKAVLATCQYLASQGYEITYLDPEPSGLLSLEKLSEAIRPDTILTSIMHVNNETGVIQNIRAIGECLREKGVLFHVDAAQSAGKLAIDLSKLPVDLMSLASHKMYGPKGVGALYIRRRPKVQLVPQIHGAGQEQGLRAGTLATHQIVGMGKACEITQDEMASESRRLQTLRERLWNGIVDLGGLYRNGEALITVCSCLNVSVDGVDGESLVCALYDLALSTGSACNAANPEPSHVLLSMGVSRDQATRALRLSIGRFTTEADVDHAIMRIREQVQRLRDLSPMGFKN